jgi:hypothetical protein
VACLGSFIISLILNLIDNRVAHIDLRSKITSSILRIGVNLAEIIASLQGHGFRASSTTCIYLIYLVAKLKEDT